MSPLVSAAWLQDRLGQVLVLDASVTRIDRGTGVTEFAPGPEGYAAEHIPSAVFADLMGAFSAQDAPFNFTAPSQARLQEAAQALGIDQDSAVVVYDSLGGAYAARLRLMLKAAGLETIAILDGGLSAWKAAGYPVETGINPATRRGNFVAKPIEGLFIDLEAVQKLSQTPDSAQPLICALREVQYEGGHIPNSLNIPYPDLLNGQGLFEADRLSKALKDQGISQESRAVLYCGGGINAAGLALGFELLGLPAPLIYDDSMAGWCAAALPLAKGQQDA